MKILVTGGSGFVGKALLKILDSTDIDVVQVGRHSALINDQKYFEVADFTQSNLWSEPLKNCDVVVHLAARVHVMKETSLNPLAEFRKVNVEGTRQLAIQAAAAGVKRLVYISSIKVNGEKTTHKPFNEMDFVMPEDAYGISKYEAELALHKIAASTELEIVIIRPPLIYGPGVRGNLLLLTKIIKNGFPLPFASINNLRSLLYVGNLIDALILCIFHPNAKGKTYLISDGDDISTPGLIKAMAEVLGVKACLLHCPIFLLKCLSKVTGKKDQMNRLLDSLQIDNSKLMQELGWKPKFTLKEGLKNTFGAGV